MPVEITEASRLYEEYQLDQAVQSLNSLSQGQLEGQPIEIQLRYYTFKGKILAIMQKYEDALTSAEKGYAIASDFEIFQDSVDKIDAYLLFSETLMKTGKIERSAEILEKADKIIQNLPDNLDILKKERRAESLTILDWIDDKNARMDRIEKIHEELLEIYTELGDLHNLARIYTYRGGFFFYTGDLVNAMKYYKKSKELFSKIEVSPFFRVIEIDLLSVYGIVSSLRGELLTAIKTHSEALNLAKEYNLIDETVGCLNNLGKVYLELADWDKAILYLNQALTEAEKSQDADITFYVLWGVFEANLKKGDLKTAESHLEQMRKVNDQKHTKKSNTIFRLCEACFLRKSKRTRDLGKAQEMLQEISEEDVFNYKINVSAMINLSEMLVLEFKDSKNPEVLNELNPLLNKLVTIAENQKSYLIMAETLLLKSKVATISLNLTEARHFINQAQIIAEKHGLRNLAIKISLENDELIKNLAVFEKMKLEQDPIERFEKSNIEKQLNDMLHKNKFSIPELKDENPVLIMVMADSGVPLYTRVFQEEWNVDQQLFSGFLSAFNTFSAEIFSKGFDRAVFGDYSILMNSIENFMIAYIFLGPSYLAKQKFSQLTENIQNSEAMQKKLHYSKSTGLVLYPKDIPELEATILDIFVQKDLIL